MKVRETLRITNLKSSLLDMLYHCYLHPDLIQLVGRDDVLVGRPERAAGRAERPDTDQA